MTRKSKARYGMNRTYKLNAAVKALRSALFAGMAMAAVAPAAQAACTSVDNVITCSGAFGGTGLSFNPGDVALPFDLTTIILDDTTVITSTGNFGLRASSYMDLDIVSDADITVSTAGYAAGIFAVSYYGDTDVTNNGDISATSSGNTAQGITALAQYGDVSVTNNGSIIASAQTIGNAFGIIASSNPGDVSVDNAGSITATSVSGRAYGIYAYSLYGDVDVSNSGDITATSTSNRAWGIYAASIYDDVSVNNDGDIVAQSTSNAAMGIFALGENATVTGTGDVTATTTTGAATGIFAQAIDDYGVITIDVSGDVTASTTGGGNAIGIRAYSYAGDVFVTSSGDITASNVNGAAIGILTGRFGYSTVDNSGNITTETTTGNSIGIQVDSFYGANITNSGDLIDSTTNGSARGIQALTTFDVAVYNSGDITASSYTGGSAQGIRAKSTNGYALIDNSGDISATSTNSNAIALLATAYYDVDIINTGDLSAVSDANVYGIYANARFGDTYVYSSGDITANATNLTGSGIYAAAGGSSFIVNAGDISASSVYANSYGAYALALFGSAAIFNSGDISVDAYYDSTGLFAKSLYGVAYINNSGDVSVNSEYGIAAYGLYASAFGSTAVVLNYGGDISASSYDSDASAIVAVALDDVVIYNSGDLSAYSYNGDAIGIVGATTDGNVTIYNIGGDISAESVYGNAYGIYARSVNGDIEVVSTGDMNISGYDLAAGIYAITDVGNASVYNSGGMTVSNSYVGAGIVAATQTGDVEVLNAGNIAVDAYAYAVGIVAGAGYGAAYVANSGDFNITAAGQAVGIHADAEYDATVFNLGDISVYSELSYAGGIFSESDSGDAYVASQGNITAAGDTYAGGILALSQYGTATVFSSGIISVSAPQGSFGISAEAEYDVFVANSGSITATAVDGSSTGINAVSYDGDVTVYNSGDFVVSGIDATGIYTYSTYGDISISNTGDLRATGVNGARGISAGTDEYDSDITISNSLNTIVASASTTGEAYGIYAYSDGSGDIGITSSGVITATGGNAYGIYAASDNDNSYYGESGVYFAGGNIGITLGAASDITATATYMGSYGEYGFYSGGDASGVYARVEEPYGNISISNAGRISATANGLYATAAGIHAYDQYDGTVSITTASTSVISATANGDYGSAFGIYANAAYGNVVISNAGSITAGASDASGFSAGIVAFSAYGTSISNTGTIGATGSDPWAIVSYSGGNTAITNGSSGILNGAIYTTNGNDSLTNSGRWNVGNANASYFGGGSDTITNNTGARIFMDDSTIDMGYSEGSSNSFLNNGQLYANGDNVIDMGGSTSVFTNNGSSIHMDDADVNDTLTIYGDFAGTGHIVVNASGTSLLADRLYIEGDVVTNTANVIDVKLLSGPSIADMLAGETIEIVHVSGTSTAANFNIGIVTPPFDELYTVESSLIKEINYSGSNDRFSLGFDITGLSTAGVVASSVAPGVQSLWNQGTGTLFQREGTHREFNQNPDGSGRAEYKAAAGVWVRGFTSSGSMAPDAHRDNFGAGGSHEFDMDGSGIEFGVGYAFNSQWTAGLLGGTSESTMDPAAGGRADIDADTLGGYVTYTPGNGFYADFSYRAMDFDGYGLGGQSDFGFEGSADGYSLEMGYGYKMSSGLIVEPQFQFSSVDVELNTIGYNMSEFELTDGDSSLWRIGAALRKSYKTAGGNYWTPYGALSWLNETDGSNSYEIGGLLTGDVDTGGGSALFEAGVTGFIGNFGISAGMNWRDGSAYDSVLGGQLSVRYDW